MTVKSFDDYFKEKGIRAYSKILNKYASYYEKEKQKLDEISKKKDNCCAIDGAAKAYYNKKND